MDVESRYDWKLIACVDDHWGIGRQGQLLVDIPADKKAFKAHTIGKIVVGGRKTMEGLPGARALPDRTNIVLSTDETYCFEGAQVLHSLQELKQYVKQYPGQEVYVIGGEEVYRLLLPYCDTAYITKVHRQYEADAYFPNLDESQDWEICEQSFLQKDPQQNVIYEFITYQRIQ